jgi:hypothetical protein
MFFTMRLHCVFGVASRMNHVASRGMSVVCRLFMVTGLVMLGGLCVVTRSMRNTTSIAD